MEGGHLRSGFISDEIHSDLIAKRGLRARKRREKSGTVERCLNSFQTAPASNDRREDRKGVVKRDDWCVLGVRGGPRHPRTLTR